MRQHLGDPEFSINKIGLARNVLEAADSSELAKETETMDGNFRRLLAALASLQRKADREAKEEKIASRINRTRRVFLAGHPVGARKEEVSLLIEEVEDQLDSSPESDAVRATMRKWRRDLELDDDPRREIEEFPLFVRELEALAYAGTQAAQDPKLV